MNKQQKQVIRKAVAKYLKEKGIDYIQLYSEAKGSFEFWVVDKIISNSPASPLTCINSIEGVDGFELTYTPTAKVLTVYYKQ
jgi:hypothetical protein